MDLGGARATHLLTQSRGFILNESTPTKHREDDKDVLFSHGFGLGTR